jgi:hypothetical protein
MAQQDYAEIRPAYGSVRVVIDGQTLVHHPAGCGGAMPKPFDPAEAAYWVEKVNEAFEAGAAAVREGRIG